MIEVSRRLDEAGHRVPLMIGGQDDRVLTLAARHADIVSIGAHPGKVDPLAERIDFVCQAAGDRFAKLELCLVVTGVHLAEAGMPDLAVQRLFYPGLSDEEY